MKSKFFFEMKPAMNTDKIPAAKTVLIVDDQDVIRLGLRSYLNKLGGYTVIDEAKNGIEAIEKARKHQPDFILMDLAMPELSGLEATKTIKQELPSIKVLIFTFWDDGNALFQGLSSGADGFCNKTMNKEELARALSVVERGQLWVNPELAKTLLKLSNQLMAIRQNPDLYKRDGADPYVISDDVLFTTDENQLLEQLAKGKVVSETAVLDKVNFEWIQESLDSIVKKVQSQNTVVDLNQFKLTKS